MSNIAFGFVGQTRFSDILNIHYKKIEKDYDFFMSTWNDENSKNINFNFLKCNKHNFEIEQKKLLNIVPGNCYDMESGKLERINKNISAQYILFHITDVLKSIKDYESKNNKVYDSIIVCRPDHVADLNVLKSELTNFTKQCFDVPIISTQSPLYINDYSFTIDNDALFIFNKLAIKHILRLTDELFVHRKDLDMKYSYRGPHEMFPFSIINNRIICVTNKIQTNVVRTQEYFDKRFKNE